MQEAALSGEAFVWLLGSLCQLNRLPFDAALLVQRFPAPHTTLQLLEAAKSLGFATGSFDVSRAGLGKVPTPCVGFLRGESRVPAIVGRIEDERVAYFQAGDYRPITTTAQEFRERFEPVLLLVRHERQAPIEGDDGAEPASKFGFRWFWEELLRHRRIWRGSLSRRYE